MENFGCNSLLYEDVPSKEQMGVRGLPVVVWVLGCLLTSPGGSRMTCSHVRCLCCPEVPASVTILQSGTHQDIPLQCAVGELKSPCSSS